MAGITQTIPQYSLGMSEQPDQLKFPGQVKEVTNAIPDITKGLYKRPGAVRIDESRISSNLPTGGSWFHYFRDETEGSYIGQVQADGDIEVFSCKDGSRKPVSFGADDWESTKEYDKGDKVTGSSNRQYRAAINGLTGGSRPSHTSGTTSNWEFVELGSTVETRIKNYLTTTVPENIQTLTINDSTFITNRDTSNANTLVGTTGTTDATPHTHFGFIELLRTENGRQYGVNINNSTATTTLTRATKIKITGNSYDEGDGSGHCPGIGTEVFAVTAKGSYGASENITHVKNSGGTTLTSGKDNLTFRITALGQQGVSPNYSAANTGPGGQNYRCSYNIEAVLLHGGEGWAVGDVVRVIPEAASNADSSNSQAFVDITVTEIETTVVNATVASSADGLIRPSPTPFNADTAVTADTILGGLKTQIDAISGVSCQIIGTGIYVFSNTQDFNLEIVEEDLMRCFQSSVNDVQNLPNQCKNGYIVKIANSRMSDEDDYYLRFEGEGGDGVGSWIECAKPGIAKTLTNMPLILQRIDSFFFRIKEFTYADRRVGDDTTNPLPSFVGQRINKVLFFRNRLAILSGENIITSRPGTLGNPDFFTETALTVSASDPVDISAASTFPSELFDGIEVNTGLVVFSTNQQFLLAADDTVFNPDTAKLRSISTFNYNETIPPISLGTTVAYVDNSGKFSRFNEMANIRREGEPNVVEVSKVVPTLLPKDIDLLTNSRENSIILLGKTNSNEVFGYKYFQVSEQRQQAAWFKWKFKNPLIYHFIINDEYFFLDTDYYLQSIKLVQSETDPTITQDNTDFLIHLDNHAVLNELSTYTRGNYNSTNNITTFSGLKFLKEVTNSLDNLVVVDTNPDSGRFGRYVKPTGMTLQTSSGTLTLPGNWRDGKTYIVPSSDINTSTDEITINNHGFKTGDSVEYRKIPPSNLVSGTWQSTWATPLFHASVYFAIKISDNVFKLATTSNNATAGTAIDITSQGSGNHQFTEQITSGLTIGYLYDYEVKFPRFYATATTQGKARADINSSLVLHRLKIHFGKIGLYETTLKRVGKPDYTEVYESTELDEYNASDAPYLDEFIQTVPVYEKNENVDVILKSSHPAPATLRSLAWEGDYSPKYYKRV